MKINYNNKDDEDEIKDKEDNKSIELKIKKRDIIHLFKNAIKKMIKTMLI